MDTNSICCVCEKNYNGSHSCAICKMPCHAICGESDEEGYGAQVICFNCKKKEKKDDDGEDDEKNDDKDDEPQLHDDEEGVPKKRYRSNDATKKLEAIEWARKSSINSASKKFRVDRKRIRDWMKQEAELKRQR